jgi:hypothetical protein
MGNPREREHLKDLRIDERVILKWIQNIMLGTWTGFVWLSLGTNGETLMHTVMNFRVHKIRVLPWLAEELLAFQEGLHRGLS